MERAFVDLRRFTRFESGPKMRFSFVIEIESPEGSFHTGAAKQWIEVSRKVEKRMMRVISGVS
jgi:hypothetical protein